MRYELDTRLQAKVDKYIDPDAEPKGPEYLRSRRKRSLDIFFSLVPLIFGGELAILGGAAAIIVGDVVEDILAGKRPSLHTPFFKEVIEYPGGKKVILWKLRTMVPDAHEQEIALAMSKGTAKSEKDSRVTKVGRFLRKSSWDELPQLLQVLRGEMSVVGPRTLGVSEMQLEVTSHIGEEPFIGFVEAIEEEEVRPGLTGFYGVLIRGGFLIDEDRERVEVGMDQRLALELVYIEGTSLKTDFKIILNTIPAVLSGRGAY